MLLVNAKEALKVLRVNRITLSRYKRDGKISAIQKGNGQFEYNDEDIYRMAGKKINRVTVGYTRVSTSKQKGSLVNQLNLIKDYCNRQNIQVEKIYSDIASGMILDRKGFLELLDQIEQRKISTIIITHRDRLTRLSYKIIESIFRLFGANILVLNELENPVSDEQELVNDIVSLIHTFSTRIYSKRRKKRLELFTEDMQIDTTENTIQ